MNDGILKINYHPNFDYIVIHQINNGKNYSDIVNSLAKNILYYPSNDIGLSKSRNLAIKKSTAKYIWIMDDDVIIDDNALKELNILIDSDLNFDMMVLSHSFQKYKSIMPEKIVKLNKISAMSVSSIDMFMKRESIINNQLFFNENFGLGTKYPSGEEYLFTIQCLKKKLLVLKTKQIFSYHPPIASGNDFYSTKNKLEAKLEMFKLSYGKLLGNIIYLLFITKKSNILWKNKKLLTAIKVSASKLIQVGRND